MTQDYPSFREHTRAPVRTKIEVRFDEAPDATIGLAANVSEGGMFIALPAPRPVGTLLRFTLTLPDDGGEVSGFAEVVWIRVRAADPAEPVGCGIQFRYLEAGGRERLRYYIGRHFDPAEASEGRR